MLDLKKKPFELFGLAIMNADSYYELVSEYAMLLNAVRKATDKVSSLAEENKTLKEKLEAKKATASKNKKRGKDGKFVKSEK